METGGIKDKAKELLLPEYEEKFSALEKIAFELHKMGYEQIEKAVIKEMAGLKMMINYIKS